MLLAIAIAYLLGLCLAGACSGVTQLVLGVIALGLASLVVLGGDELSVRPFRAPLAALAFAAGLATPTPQPPPLLARGPTAFAAVVESELVKPDGRSVVVRVLAPPGDDEAPPPAPPPQDADEVGRRAASRARVQVPAGTRVRVPATEVAVGARVHVRGEFVPSLAYRNVSPHPAWPDARPTAGVVPNGEGRTVETHGVGLFDRAVAAARANTRAALYRSLSSRVAGVAAALVLGDGALLDETDAANIRGAGLTHVLAVSGTHIAMVAGMFVLALERALRRFPRVLEPRRVAAALGIPFALLHAVFAGSVPSGMRAAVTASVAFGLVASNRRPDALETTAFASLLLALPEPMAATRPGFLLSVLATVAVITAAPPEDASLRASVLAAARLTLRCTLATAPLVVHTFGDVPLASLAANLLLVPLGSVALLPLSLVHAGLALAAPDLATLSAALFEPCARAFLTGSLAFGSVDDGVALPPTTAAQSLFLVAMVGVAAAVRTRAFRPLLALVAAYGLEELRVRTSPRLAGEFVIHQLDIGQGDAAFLRFPDGRAGMIDFGPHRPDVGTRVVVPFLRAERVSRLDFALLTHRHPDHYGGLASVARAVRIGTLLEPGEVADEGAGGEASRVLSTVAASGTRVVGPSARCAAPEVIAGVRVEVLHPCPEAIAGFSLNDGSIVVRFTYGRHAFLWVGDAERAAEGRMLDGPYRRRLDVDVLKVGHHGSRTSTSAAFVRAVSPRIAVLSAGPGNRFDHPHGETLATLRAAHTTTYRTDLHGGVRFVTDGRDLRVLPAVR